MPIKLYWGENEFLINRAVQQLLQTVLDKQWVSFNYTEYLPESKETIYQAFSNLMTAPVGSGGRLVHLTNSYLLGVCPEEILLQLERILPNIPETNVLLITSTNKPDGRNKSVKLLLEYGEVREFALIPQWQTEALTHQVRALALEIGVTLTSDGCKELVESTGNNTRLLRNELEKLSIYASGIPVNAEVVASLVNNGASNNLLLANAIRLGNVSEALELLENLIRSNEPALRIACTLVTMFRTWLVVKLMVASGCKDDGEIAKAAELKNPKRLYFLRQEITCLSLSRLKNALKILLELELMLKSGNDEKLALQTQIIQLCNTIV
ncbi:DNA polymerase III subunit delta [Dulcicalothrix desertica PCC 7102]|uniref:DNA polymerase III subunit delta n=1 Tax=Dulcicalothrix desertica PCC 7102 TaxID=232991 RepID=A0A3S1A4W0_9CYAN|nr:DNA polymerase III subunit delta [Dulcicalothrix desertica]RUS93430.1 DNA polymerase III subunit delta [Dulcicalothrix desertica PCC 7102]TWH61319.1 DNA polymerase III delta subunit [Dulcicalothrix desertica PCC 7102]